MTMERGDPGTPSKKGASDLWHPQAAVINAAAFAFNVAVVGASAVGLFGLTQKGVTDTYPTLVTPAIFSFAIWNVIYGGEALWVGWALLRGRRSDSHRPPPSSVAAVGPWFAVANVLQALWSVPWAREALRTSTAINWGATAALYAASAGLRRARSAPNAAPPAPIELWGAHLTVPLHAGWVLAATLVNANMALVGASATVATQLYAAAATALGLAAAGWWAGLRGRDVGFGAGVAWALLGIAANQSVRSDRLSPDVARGLQVAVGAAGAALAVALARVVKRRGGVDGAVKGAVRGDDQ